MAFVTLSCCNTVYEAHLIKGMLKTNGIQCFLTNENISVILPHLGGMMGSGVQVMVEENDITIANELIQNQNTNLNKITICPYCHSTNIKSGLGKNKLKKIFIIALSLFFSTPFGNIKSVYHCNDCNKDFD